MDDLTFVVPTRDRPDLLLRAVRSITRLGHSVVVVDDGSTSAVVLAHPQVTVLRHEVSRGVAAARNTGIDAVQTAWVAFLDDDDEALARPAPRGEVTVYGFPRIITADTVLDSFTPSVGQTAVRTEVCPRFDDTMTSSEDVEWWLRLATSLPVTHVPEPGFRWNRHDGARLHGGEASAALLGRLATYYATHPRARAFRLARLAAAQRRSGSPRALVTAGRAMLAHPSRRPLVALIKGV